MFVNKLLLIVWAVTALCGTGGVGGARKMLPGGRDSIGVVERIHPAPALPETSKNFHQEDVVLLLGGSIGTSLMPFKNEGSHAKRLIVMTIMTQCVDNSTSP